MLYFKYSYSFMATINVTDAFYTKETITVTQTSFTEYSDLFHVLKNGNI